MKKGWVKKRLEELGKTQTGSTPETSDRDNFGEFISFIKPGDFNADGSLDYGNEGLSKKGLDGARIVPAGSVLMVCIGGTIGKCGYCDQDITTNQQVNALIPFDGISHKFIYYQMLTENFQRRVLLSSGQATLPIINKSKWSTLTVVLPANLEEQHRIVDILDEAFDGLARATANAEQNLRNARALFESHLQTIFGRRDDSPVMRIGDIAEVFDGPHATPKTVEVGPVFLGISALQDGKINLGETRHVTPDDFRRWTRRVKPQTDDVVFSYETRLGQAAIIPDGLECCLGRRMGLVRLNRKRVDPRFFVYQYISPSFRSFLDTKTVHGATVDRIALKEFPFFPIKLPSLLEQEQIANRLDSLRTETQRLESIYQQKLAALGELKKSLLHQAFSGQL